MSIRVMKLVLFALVLLSSAVSSNCQYPVISYLPNELNALGAIFGDWNQTPNIAINLPGWTSNTSVIPCFNDAWKGVLCVRYPAPDYDHQESIVVGL
jgi:hypothetical protein